MGLEARATVPAAPTKPTVVLACSTADAVALPRVLKRLVDVGVRVDVCAGVELDARPLQRALARGNTRTSYAICRSRELDGDQLDRLYRLACDAGIPSARLAVLRFEVERPDELTGALLQRLADHGFADVPGAPVALSSEDVTEPVMIIPRDPSVTRIAERSAAVLHLVPEPSPTPPSIAAPRRSRFAPVLGCTLALAAIAVLVLGWLTHIGDAASVASAGLAAARSSSAAAVLADGPRPELPDHVAAALAARTIRVHDGLLVASPGDVSMHRPVARRRCNELYVAGISDWRMPTRSELDALAGAGFLAADTTWWLAGEERERPRARWTGTRVDGVEPTSRASARTVCVHDPVP